jgi:hypothetical protein
MESKLYYEFQNYFSVWIFLFFLMYYTKLSYFNPIILLIIALLSVTFTTVYVFIETRDLYHLFRYTYLNIIIKVIPIYLIINKPIYWHDLIISAIMTFMYYVYITFYRRFSIIEFYQQIPSDFIKDIKETFINNNKNKK